MSDTSQYQSTKAKPDLGAAVSEIKTALTGKAEELAGDAYTQRGVYLRLRFKFDENLFQSASDRTPSAFAGPVSN